jgi:hypothetical protein
MSDSPTKSFTGKAAGINKLLRQGWAALLAAVFLAGALPAAAHGDEATAKSGRVPVPQHVAEKGDKCVRDTDYMRRNHMNLLKHQRDETMRKGIRTTQYSLKNCIECHASQKTNSVIGSNDNFCQSCHSYVGVKLDCFECHSSKPKATKGDTLHPIVAPSAQPVGDDKQSSLSSKMRWQMQANLASLNRGEVVK